MTKSRPSLVAATVVLVTVTLPAAQAVGAISASGSYWPDPLHSGDGVVASEMQLGLTFMSTGAVTVTGGDVLTTQSGSSLGYATAATGTVTVTDSTWTAELAVFIAPQSYAHGTVDLTGSTWNVNSNVAMAQGDGATATVNLSGGSSWTTMFGVTMATGENLTGADCTAEVNLNDGTWTAQTGVTVGGSGFVGSNGSGRINIKADGTMTSQYGLTLTEYGSVELDGGTLSLAGDNEFGGALTATANGGTVRLLVGPTAGGMGRVDVGDGVDFTGCDLDIVFHDSFTPDPASTFDLFDPLDSADLAAILGNATISTPVNWQLDLGSGVLSAVPEPATMALLGAGLLAIIGRRRVRRA